MSKGSELTLHKIKAAFEEKITKSSVRSIRYIALYEAVKKCIVNRDIPQGWTIPSTREISKELHISRSSVLKSYELLVLEKLIISKPGSGYSTQPIMPESQVSDYKTQDRSHLVYPEISETGRAYHQNISIINRDKSDHVAFRPGLPPLDVFPINRWKNLINSYWRHVKISGLGYSQTSGLQELKQSICNYLNVSRNIHCSPEQMVIVSGSLQSLYLISNTLIDPGDQVVVENPVFPNVHSVFKSSRAEIVPISLDSQGIDVEGLSKMAAVSPKLIHVTPSNHYPMGVKMTLERREELLQYASKNGALVIENDYEHEIANQNGFVPSLYALDQEDRTIYMGTFNRILHPSIRLGYMVVPKYLKPIVESLQEHSHRFVPPSLQVVMSQFIEKNYLYQHIEQSIKTAKDRFNFFEKEFKTHIKELTLQEVDFASFHRVAFFNERTSPAEEAAFINKLERRGIKVLALSKCYIGEPFQTGLIFGYSAPRSAQIGQKLEIIGRIPVKE
jgi:GntR family transcriptional regulator/MocR family aminotransferase